LSQALAQFVPTLRGLVERDLRDSRAFWDALRWSASGIAFALRASVGPVQLVTGDRSDSNLKGETLMRKSIFGPILGLSIVAGSLAVPAPASATEWRNLASGLCLGVANASNNSNHGQPLIIWPCNGSRDQQWTESAFTPAAGYSWLTTALTDTRTGAPKNFVMGVSGGNSFVTNGTALIDWEKTNDANQGWQRQFAVNDPNSHQCFAFINNVQPRPVPRAPGITMVAGVSGGRRDAGAPVMIWSQFTNSFGQPDYGGHPDQFWCQY
jgi:hypothetical protein